MDRRLIDYLPPALQFIAEFCAITDAQQPEIEKAWDALNLVIDNQFVGTATEDGVLMWERELNIIPRSTDTLNDRKRRIISTWTYGVVYTYNWLVDWLRSSLGTDSSLPTIDNYVVHVNLPISSDYIHMLEEMRRNIPANMIIDPTLSITTLEMTQYIGMAAHIAIAQEITTTNWDTSNIDILADENGNALTDESGNILYEEVTA